MTPITQDTPKENAIVKLKYLFQIFFLLVMLFGLLGDFRPAHADARLAEQPIAAIISHNQSEPSLSTLVNPATIPVGENAAVTVSLNDIPAEGYTSTEITCSYAADLGEVSNIIVTDLFGADPAVALNGPQDGRFILAVASSNGNHAATGGSVLTFDIRGLQVGQAVIECTARVSAGDSVLVDIPSTPAGLTILGITPTPTLTSTPLPEGMLTGQVLAGKPVTISLYNADNTLAVSAAANADGTFSLTAAPGTYTVIATAGASLGAQGSVTLSDGNAITLPTISLSTGDIDNNNVIDQFDALTLGMNYNTVAPSAADLNGDGIINVLDLELLAQNYRKTGPLAWQ